MPSYSCADPYLVQYFGVNSSQVRDGRIVTFDSRRRWRSRLNLARDATTADALRFGWCVLRVKRREEDGYLSSPYFRKLGIRCGARPVSHFFSPEFCRRIIRPMSIRMNGAEPDEIYMGTLGSNIRMVLDSFDQLQEGVRPVLESFARGMKVHLGMKVQSLVADRRRIKAVRVVRKDGRIEELGCAGAILATPAEKFADGQGSVLGQSLPVRVLLENLGNGVEECLSTKFLFSRETLQQHTPKGPDVGPLIHRSSTGLFRIHVG